MVASPTFRPVDTARIDVTGSVRVRSEQGELQGAELGGRRSRVALVAVALHRQPLPAQRLAEIVWSDSPPVDLAGRAAQRHPRPAGPAGSDRASAAIN